MQVRAAMNCQKKNKLSNTITVYYTIMKTFALFVSLFCLCHYSVEISLLYLSLMLVSHLSTQKQTRVHAKPNTADRFYPHNSTFYINMLTSFANRSFHILFKAVCCWRNPLYRPCLLREQNSATFVN